MATRLPAWVERECHTVDVQGLFALESFGISLATKRLSFGIGGEHHACGCAGV
jgi:hypothetical protein